MLIKGQIPTKEPNVSIGLVLPEDQQKSVTIKSSDSKSEHQILVQNDTLLLDGNPLPRIHFNRSTSDSYFTIHPIRAGRGFHWEKHISIQVLGSINISIKDGALFVINQIPVEQYLMCVATSEMSGDCPPALLESQTIAARSWLLAADEQKHAHLELDACNDDCCQRYQGMGNLTETAKKASLSTRGKVIMHHEAICDTRYSKSCGGVSESNESVWEESAKPYLRAIHDSPNSTLPDLQSNENFEYWYSQDSDCFCSPRIVPENELHQYLGHVDKSGSYFRWDVSFKQEELIKLISNKTNNPYDSIQSIKPLKRGLSGRIIQLEIKGQLKGIESIIILDSEYEIRRVLHPNFMFSSAFFIKYSIDRHSNIEEISFYGAGWGHGAGLCQIGALGMALNHYSTEEILNHYFKSTELEKIYD
ncbi:MAG: SpoIID/LytB domain-containing protein [Candidatus Marinimicrobia bacterium]|nr:SpoIID/LytB domain-containing protein [Candidatus Neomarinimicrobiota bacterium]